MDALLTALPWILGGLILVVALSALHTPLRKLLCLLGRTAAGLGALFLFNPLGGLIGVHLGINLANALVLGLLGAPGFALLLLLTWTLR